ncbi:MAG: HAMP domain-containing protein [Gammaproteobacteria bacterium]|nr:HAMP domain-containing protein [Gammaproteobacteria bacterium]
MPRFRFPIRVKVLLTVLLLIMIVMSLNTSTMANLFRDDKTTYIRDLTAVMAIHVAEESETLLRNYVSNMQAFGDVIYDPDLDSGTKQEVIQNLFRNYQDIVAITARRGDAAPVTAFDTSDLTRLDVSRAALLEYRDANPLPNSLSGRIDVKLETIRRDLSLLRLMIDVPATESREAFMLAASIKPDRLASATKRARGFKAAILNSEGQSVFEQDAESARGAAFWAEEIKNTSGAAVGTALEFEEDGVAMIGAYAPMADGSLWATITVPSSVVYLTARELLSNLTIGALLLFAIAAIASLIFARRLSRPLEHLTEAAERVGKGEFEVVVEATSSDEIGALSHSFNQMTDELRERDVKLAGANAALVQSEKLAAFGQLGAGIAHEVKNPLAGILGYAQLTLRKLDEDSPFKKNLDIIESETRRCTEIISNLLKFARQESAVMEPTDINEVVDAALQIVDHQLGVNNVKLRKELATDLPACDANANQLQQAIMNFAINAQQAMGSEGGNLILRTHTGPGDEVMIEIEDDGPGIPDEIKANIFEPFFTTKPAGQGTGLGLSVTHGIIHDHGGTIRIEDVEGGGTRFLVSLPAWAAKAA